MNCPWCGCAVEGAYTHFTEWTEDPPIIIEKVPCYQCTNCREILHDPEAQKRIQVLLRRILRNPEKADKKEVLIGSYEMVES